MKIQKIVLKNFRSFGNNPVTFSFNGGLNLLTGKNGSGKSSVRLGIEFALFGKVKNLILNDVVNRVNKKNCLVELFFSVSDVNYKIVRGIAPNIFDLYRINELGEEERINFKDKRETQNYLEDEILGISYDLFVNSLSISVDDFKSYIRLSLDERRKVFDKLFNFSIFNKIKEEINSEKNSLVKERDKVKLELDHVKSDLENLLLRIENIKGNLYQSSNLEKQNLIERRKQVEKNIKEFIRELKERNDELVVLSSKEKEFVQKIYEINSDIKSLNQKLHLYNEERCITCGQKLAGVKHIEDLKVKILSDLKTLQSKKGEFEATLSSIRDSIKEISLDIENIKREISRNEFEKSDIDNKLKIIDSNKESNVLLEEINMMKQNLEERYKKLLSEYNNLEDKILKYNLAISVLSESGVKDFIMRKITPSLNKIIDFYRLKLNFPYRIKFTESMDVLILYLGKYIQPLSLSTGEKKKLDIILLLSILRFMKSKFVDLNLLFIDELFSSLDFTSQESVLSLLKEICDDMDMTICIVNHSFTNLNSMYIDNIYQFDLVNRFSTVSLLG